jgi:hypothetical protein
MLPPISRISNARDKSDLEKFLRDRCALGHGCRGRLKSIRRANAHPFQVASDDTAVRSPCELETNRPASMAAGRMG